MKSYILVTFGLLGVAWYEMSGGADFGVEHRTEKMASAVTAPMPEVSRGSTDAATLATVAQAKIGQARIVPASATVSSGSDLKTPDAQTLAQTAKPKARPETSPVPKLDITLASVRPMASPGVPIDAAQGDEAIQLAAVATTSDATPEDAELAVLPDMRKVTGTLVNMRNGPGTRFHVVDQLSRGASVEVLADPGDGWVRLKVTESNRVGWMSDDFLRVAAD
ncbi:SH3 domain-containing protein [Salipiger thiooxidans]|uniref:SH3 domain-containing protein n=1 Tax=Salipiger thiooxidans TaxID=282683 RepID=A0A1G7M2S9_9RHOB|nr:SH3 domain-containing protein [Salipiger thiooxidans]SDF55941.1 SH3 domain-containing protein [Salipiger thiooxidans]